MSNALLTLTENALARIDAVTTADNAHKMLRLRVKQGGCSGLSYQMDLVETAKTNDLKVEQDGRTLLVDPAAALYLTGSTMDYVETPFKQGFEFENPNETNRCGCGESFSV